MTLGREGILMTPGKSTNDKSEDTKEMGTSTPSSRKRKSNGKGLVKGRRKGL